MFKSETIAELQDQLRKGKLDLIDVREAFEYEAGHVPGAVNMPLSNFEETYKQLDKNTSYHIICQSGGRSAQAVAFLDNEGFKDVINVDGGIGAWLDSLE
ncbi:rhodanese-like domain-containing protein [Streptococcus catagoni]|uniref:rhodanese-like domain-containing protein n=1 Tax=Streptococcus catagoni TaxID=2654874 RepID=UPI00140C9232|nr:rhodanese-like domain-containing protein [Streptococcus catagoni]